VPCPLSGGLGDSRFRVLSPSLPELEGSVDALRLHTTHHTPDTRYTLFHNNLPAMLSKYAKFYQDATDDSYDQLVKLNPNKLESIALNLASNHVFLAVGSDGRIMPLHRLERVARLENTDLFGHVVGFCGDVDSLAVHKLSDDLFETSNVRVSTVEYITNTLDAEVGAVDNPAWKAAPTNDTEYTMCDVPHVILVPPSCIHLVLGKKFTPRELWTKVVEGKLGDRAKYDIFIKWACRALTSDSVVVAKVGPSLDHDGASMWKTTRLTADLPGYRPPRTAASEVPTALIFPFSHQGQKIFYMEDSTSAQLVVDLAELAAGHDKDFMMELEGVGKEFMSEDGCRVNSERLCEVVKLVKGSPEWARYSLKLADERPPIIGSFPSEMFLQQHVFSCVSALLYSFSPVLFTCDTMLNTPHYLYDESPLNIKPDSAIKASHKSYYVVCMMELKNQKTNTTDPDKADLRKAVLFTCLSALALRRVAGILETISIPFVLGSREMASLYATVLREGEAVPSVKFILTASLFDGGGRDELFQFLAVLLLRIVMQTTPNAVRRKLDDLPPSSGPGYEFKSTSRSSKEPPPRSSEKKGSDGEKGSKQKKSAGAARQRAGASLNRAQALTDVAACFGAVGDIEHPSNLAPCQFSDDSDMKSPWYHVGKVLCGHYQGVPVFIKTWREGDRGTNLETISSEIALLRKAFKAGVPCPEVIDHLTELNIDYVQDIYHRLVMKKLESGSVDSGDIEAFAESLIRTVVSLHKAGILHCDIKPDNVVWDKAAKIAYLVDFGHSQEEEGALPYLGTQGYTAPCIELENTPHSQLTDGYSVGKTLQKLLRDLAGDLTTKLTQVPRIAEDLCRGLTLEDVLTYWEHSVTVSPEQTMKTSPSSVMAPVQ
jgi:Protein kinase domain